jgi:hypothetical protein
MKVYSAATRNQRIKSICNSHVSKKLDDLSQNWFGEALEKWSLLNHWFISSF